MAKENSSRVFEGKKVVLDVKNNFDIFQILACLKKCTIYNATIAEYHLTEYEQWKDKSEEFKDLHIKKMSIRLTNYFFGDKRIVLTPLSMPCFKKLEYLRFN